ncbi:MAG: lytic transglycosylase domain-containing protein [Victivallaceae bacterium]
MRRSKKNRLVKFCFLMLMFAAAVFSLYYYRETIRDLFLDDSRYDALIVQAARKHGVDSRLVKAVIYRESRFDPSVRGRAGEIGLMQIMPETAVKDWARVQNVELPTAGMLYSPQLNIEVGTWYLAKAMAQWRDYKCNTELALCQYNAGESRARSWKPDNYDGEVIDRIKIKSTKSYVETIMKKYRAYCKKGMIQP